MIFFYKKENEKLFFLYIIRFEDSSKWKKVDIFASRFEGMVLFPGKTAGWVRKRHEIRKVRHTESHLWIIWCLLSANADIYKKKVRKDYENRRRGPSGSFKGERAEGCFFQAIPINTTFWKTSTPDSELNSVFFCAFCCFFWQIAIHLRPIFQKVHFFNVTDW